MSEDKPSSGRSWGWGAAVIALAVVAGTVSVIVLDEGLNAPERPDEPKAPRPTVTPATPRPSVDAKPRAQRISLTPPDDHRRPEAPDNPTPNNLTPDMRRTMNYFVDDILVASRDKCILPWLAGYAPGATAEFVFDVVMYDGQMYDIGLRSLDHELPERVRSCVGDQAWSQEVPDLDLPGEVRLQRSITWTNAE